jgi:dissimilatory sulfite reductase (desulfoviridin) alpha/beta subunit
MKRPQAGDGYELQPCRGLEGTCPFALVKDSSLVQRIDLVVRASVWWQRFNRDSDRVRPHHARFRVALAACPNACTMPQIRDIGIIAAVTPQAIQPECNGCGCCERTCREGAIVVQDGRAVFHEERCVGCGQCIQSCPQQVIDPGPVKLRVLVGGRMGRHPRWAEELCEADLASAADIVRAFLDCVAQEMRPAEHLADAVERIGIERLRQAVSSMRTCEEPIPRVMGFQPMNHRQDADATTDRRG